MDKFIFVMCVSFSVLALLFMPGCSCQVDEKLPTEILAEYDTPVILVPYDEIIKSCSLKLNDNFSTKEVEEIYNLIDAIKNEPPAANPDFKIAHFNQLSLNRDTNTGIISAYMTDYHGPTSSIGTKFKFYRTSTGKFLLVEVNSWIS